MNNPDIEKILVSDGFSYVKNKEINAKCFTGYKKGKKFRPLVVQLSQMSEYPNEFKGITYKDEKVLYK